MTLHLKPASLYASQGMEDGPAASALIAATATTGAADAAAAAAVTASPYDNGIAMANFPTNDDAAHETPATPPKVNGDAQPDSPPPPQLEKQVTAPVTDDIEEEEACPPPLHDDDVQSRLEDMITAVTVFEHDEHGDDEGSSSGCDHLVIDEEVKPARRRRKAKVRQAQPPCLSPMVERNNIAKATPTETPGDNIAQVDGDQRVVDDIGLKLAEDYIHTNPYFAESLFELSKHYNTTQPAEGIPKLSLKKIGNRYARKRGKNGTPKLREYAQYLGLQPTVQFKCSKCGSAGFESLQLLNEHLVHCTAVAPMHPPPSPNTNTQHSSTNFKVTRKVFLCSACGTYYENWNLFLHMREVHRRYICLYCLGMFPHADKLAAHLVGKHNCAPPARHADEAQFARAHHREPCLLMCCDCQRVFTEQDCVTRHKCADGGGGEEVVDPAMGGAEKEQHDVQVTTNQLVIETSATRDGELSLTGTVEVANASDALQEGVASDVEGRGQCEDNDAERDSESERENDADVADDSVRSDPEERLHSDAHDSDDQHGDEEHDEESNNSDEKDDHAEQMDIDHPEYPPAEDPRPTDGLQDDRKVPKVTLKLPRIYTTSAPEDPQRTHSQDDDPPSEDYSEDDSDKNSDPEEHTQPEAKDTSLLEPNSEADVDVDIEGNTSQEEPEVNVGNTNDTSEHPEEVNIEGQEHTEGGNTITEETSEAQQLYVTAGSDIPINEIELDQPLDKFDIKLLLQKCLQATISVCLYCNHARKIAVNGKQLGLHAIAEHRYSSVVKSITAEELIPESFNNRIRESLDELDRMYFTLEVAAATPTDGVSFTHLFECFQCRYSSNVHKELFMHNRKLHAKALLLCTMCKTSFYSYSELLCHLCPGVYSSDRDRDVLYRCCMCVSDDLPSAFRLVVHLRKKHHACDVCLEICHNQMRLSNHVWKHKLHHLCYRCGIAYRNKPDITKHLFWKHGTESVQCKKCLQKKWPHVYHFCQPPATFTCDQCSTNLTSAIKLKVHRRLHTNELPHHCPEEGCEEKFISKRLLAKHDKKTHREPEEVKPEPVEEVTIDVQEEPPEEPKQEEVVEEKEKEVPKPKVDVYDLPELNLSESDSDSEDESSKSTTIFKNDASLLTNTDLILETTQDDILKLPDEIPDEVLSDSRAEASPETTDVVLDIWNNFKTYQENIAKTILSEVSKDDDDFPEILTCIPPVLTLEEALRDHDYCPRTTDVLIEEEPQLEQPVVRQQASPLKTADHDYCSGSSLREPEQEGLPQLGVLPSSRMTLIEEPEVKAVEKVEKVSSDSSSDSDSSSCTCGSNCSCSSGSSSSSSSDSSESDSSSEEGRRRQQVRREKRRGRKPKTQADNMPPGEAQASKLNERLQKDEPKPVSSNPLVKAQVEEKETPIRDSDLSTTESDTDEEFYDKEPQKIANKLLAEKREKLMQLATTGTYINGTLIDSRPTTPSIIPEDANNTESVMVSPEKGKKQKKSKSKKKKKKKAAKREAKLLASPQTPYLPHQHRHHHHQQVAPLTLSLTKCAPMTPVYNSPLNNSNHIPVNNSSSIMAPTPILTDNENSTTRASKRRRVPNKFYGYSSDEENEKVVATGAPNIKFRKVDLPSPKPHLVVPPITIKTTPVVDPISIRVSLNPKEMKVQPLRLPVPKRRRSTAKTKVRRAPRPQPPPPQAYPGTPSPMRSPAALPPPQPTPARMIHTGRKSQPAVTPPPPPPHPILQASRPDEYENDSNSSTSDADEDPPMMPQPLPHAPPHAPPMGAMSKPNAPTAALYCYCKCPYDEVSEMIGCDSDECAIEWFHFECVGIMVPPKGQWFCPDCRKKKQQRREILQQAQVK